MPKEFTGRDRPTSVLEETLAAMRRSDIEFRLSIAAAFREAGFRNVNNPREVQVTTPPPPPLQAAHLLLRFALPLKHQDEIIGDLDEEYYTKWLPEHGARKARRFYWWHAIRSIAPMLWTGLRRSAIITFILGAADWLRDRIG